MNTKNIVNEKFRQIGVILFSLLTIFSFIGQFTSKLGYVPLSSSLMFLLATLYSIFAYAIHAGFKKLNTYNSYIGRNSSERVKMHAKTLYFISKLLFYMIFLYSSYELFSSKIHHINWSMIIIPTLMMFISKNYFALNFLLKKLIHFNQDEKISLLDHK